MTTKPIAKINLSALAHNLQYIRQLMPHQKVIPMVKGNAYGHGIMPISRALSNADALGVATLPESLQLRAAGIKNDIVVMRGFIRSDEIPAFIEDPNLFACVHDHHQLSLLEALAPKKTLSIWLKINTGMNRLGINYQDCHDVYQRLSQLSFIKKPFCVMSHLADSDNQNTIFTKQQLHHFSQAIEKVTGEKSLLNSAGILAFPEAAYDWVRPGIMLYGVSPFGNRNMHQKKINPLRAAMNLEGTLIATKIVDVGESIGYGCAFRTSKRLRVGVVGIGYGDGYPRHAKTGTPVLIHDKRCPLVGRVSMDMITVDLSNCSQAEIGDPVTLWGDQLPIEEIAACTGTIPNELLCRVTGRVQYAYV